MATEIFRTYKNVFDQSTIQAIWYLITHHKIEGLESPIKVGKESNVFSALTKENKRVAVKIYRIEVCDFFRMSEYLAMDKRFRFTGRRKQIVLVWAQREFKNLMKAYQAKVSVPKPIAIRDNVIIMKFIGNRYPKNPESARLLKDNPGNEKMPGLVVNEMKKLYKAGLVHGDLSEFNILNLNDKPMLIDLSHSLPVLSNSAEELLNRDVENVCRFFNKKGFKLNKEDVLKEIKEK
jgi:RIO kinase 1